MFREHGYIGRIRIKTVDHVSGAWVQREDQDKKIVFWKHGYMSFDSSSLQELTCMHCVYFGTVNMQSFLWIFLCAMYECSFIHSFIHIRRTGIKKISYFRLQNLQSKENVVHLMS